MASPPQLIINADSYTVTFQFRSDRGETPLYILTDANNWAPELMTVSSSPIGSSAIKDNTVCYEKSFVVPRDTQEILYKFRFGDWEYFYDISSPTENDNRGSQNNRLDITGLPPPPPYDDVDELAEEPPSPKSFIQIDGDDSGPQTPRNHPASPTLSVSTSTSGCISLSESDRWTVLSDDLDTDAWP